MLACTDSRPLRRGSKKRPFADIGPSSDLPALRPRSWGPCQPKHAGQWVVPGSASQQEDCRWLAAGACSEPLSGLVPEERLQMDFAPDLSSLRAAAAAAVADCTGALREGSGSDVSELASTQRDAEHPSSQSHAAPLHQAVSESDQGEVSSTDIAGPAAAAAPPGSSGQHPPRQPLTAESSPESPTEGPAILAGQVMLKVDSRYSCPPHGAKAICGRRPKMEDAYTAVPFLLEVPVHRDRPASADLLPPRIAKEVKSAPSSANSDASDQAAETDSSDLQEPLMETLHFFGVFDGHGGAEAALHCAQTLHQRIAEALSVATSPTAHSDLASSASRTAFPSEGSSVSREDSHEGSSAPCTPSAATDPDEPAQLKSRVSSQELKAVPASPHLVSHKDLVKQTDALVDTAVLEEQEALVGSRHLYVANCGDSRAVLCRGGYACALTDDHKAAREDETARVEAAGGQILFWNGVRVMGVLAVSRAIGDHCLRPYVIADPEVTIIARRAEDELLLLASDGLWDVLSNQEAISLAKRCLRRARQRGASRQSAARIAATVLTRAAVDRGSRDNVTVVVVDLAPPSADSQAGGTDDGTDDQLDEPSMERQPSQRLRPGRSSSGASPTTTGASDHLGRMKLQSQSSHFSSEPSGSFD
ncbi:hypothetical protein WJX84_006806 [Apatococcus fuscideae]|uniref:protein-serine/threonine phosphatase n=1 Tax=Apatococcus fuscideae TaxID=2026836 RepID=A0AAW1S8H7_9CHLO